MRNYLAIGGLFANEQINYETAKNHGYHQFNCASNGCKTKTEINRCKRLGRPIIPSMVWLHESLFEVLKNGNF